MYSAAVWLQRVREEYGSGLTINWKYFSLEQVNTKQGPDWKLWEQPDDYESPGRKAFQAAEAARNQSEESFTIFHYALLRARHEDKRNIAEIETLVDLAVKSGLNMSKFHRDLKNRRLLERLGESHTYAVEVLKIFGTPTLVFPEKQVVYLKISPPPSLDEAVTVFEEMLQMVINRPQIREIKRPQ